MCLHQSELTNGASKVSSCCPHSAAHAPTSHMSPYHIPCAHSKSNAKILWNGYTWPAVKGFHSSEDESTYTINSESQEDRMSGWSLIRLTPEEACACCSLYVCTKPNSASGQHYLAFVVLLGTDVRKTKAMPTATLKGGPALREWWY